MLSAVFTLQCVGCGEALIAELTNGAIEDLPNDPTDEDLAAAADVIAESAIQCPRCSEAAGVPVVIEVAALAGSQLDSIAFDDDDDDDEPGDEAGEADDEAGDLDDQADEAGDLET